MSKVRGGRVRFDPDRILMSGGATGANELIMFCLADPGDAFLVPSPYYPAYVTSLFITPIYVWFYSMYVHYFKHTLKVDTI
jgi:aspartate/methionine/tyrosine aminotransferase